MLRFLNFLLVVLALAYLFAWITDNPGTVFLQWDWLAARLGRPGEEVGIPLVVALVGLVILVALAMAFTSLFKGIFGMPGIITRFFDNRRKEKGYRALSRGLIAASSGDIDSARIFAKESGKLLDDDPLVALLGTQTALLEGDRSEATENFKMMLENEDTRLVALRGLFLEAERQGQTEAARHYAEEAARNAPALPWAGNAKLRYQAHDADWDAAIKTLEANRSAGLVEKTIARRQRAVLLTAKAMSVEQASPDRARKLAREAHKLSKGLVPAATVYARVAARQGDIRGASKVIEVAWGESPHPELAEAYSTVRVGDSVQDRLKRARKLASINVNHPEGNIAIAIAAIDAKQWDEARQALGPVLTSRPSERACLLMADIEEGEHGDHGRMRDWLSRAVRAPADEAWTADGYVSDEWLPLSPVTGEIDAFEWKQPVSQIGDAKEPVMSLEELQAAAGPAEAAKPVSPVVAAVIDKEDALGDDMNQGEDDVQDAEILLHESVADNTMSGEAAEREDSASGQTHATRDGMDADNVVQMEPIASTESMPEQETGNDQAVKEGKKVKSEGTSPYDNSVKFPMERRPDDPGPHPEKEPPRKGFRFF